MAKGSGALARVHGRLALVAGLALVGWIVSALGMLLPWGIEPFAPSPIPFDAVALSPAELAARLGPERAPSEVALRSVDGIPVYAVRRDDGPVERFDARSGAPFLLPLERAEGIARRSSGSTAPLADIERHDAYTPGYAWGPLPVVRVVFADAPSVSWFVDPDGRVRRSAPVNRLRQWFDDLHRLEPLKALGDAGHRVSLIALALLALAAATSGYLLALARRPWRRRGGGQAGGAAQE